MAKTNKLFVDSNFFVALLNPVDTLNLQATQVSEKIKLENPVLVISNFIFLETVTMLAQRVDRQAAFEFGDNLLKDEQVAIVHIDEDLQEKTWEVFKEVTKKNFSFVDASILAVMRSEGITELLTFDHQDFKSLRSKYNFSFYS